MKVAGFDRYDLHNTPQSAGATFTIWFSGCTHRCDGCQNQKLWDGNYGDIFTVDELYNLIEIETSKTKIHTVTLLGGEPLQQPIHEILDLCTLLNANGYEIWLYTGYKYEEVCSIAPTILQCIDYLKCGKYIEELRADEGTFPITTNQMVYSKAGGWKPINIKEE